MTKEEVNHVLRFVKKLFILAVLLFLLDRGLGALLAYEYKKNPPPDAVAFNHVVKSPLEDVFIFGSSKAAHGYVSNIFADSLGLTCFNAGREQTNILYADIVVNEMLRQHTPKVVILDITAKETVANSMEASRLILSTLMMPDINTDTAMHNLGKQLFPKEMVTSELSLIQRFNSQILPLIASSFSKKKDTRTSQNGYIPAHGSKVIGDLPSFEDRGERYDSTAINYFENFITVLQAKGVKLYVVQSPYYVQKFTTSTSLQEMNAVMQRHNVKLLDYSFDPEFFRRDYFYDFIHLNDRGAHAFSEKLASDIKKDLQATDASVFNQQTQTIK